MENGKPNKIKVSAKIIRRIESAEDELRELIQAGNATQGMRDALTSIQAVLPILEEERPFAVNSTWPGPEDAA